MSHKLSSNIKYIIPTRVLCRGWLRWNSRFSHEEGVMACCEYVKMFKDDIDLSLRVGWKLNNTGSRPSTDAWILDTERVQADAPARISSKHH